MSRRRIIDRLREAHPGGRWSYDPTRFCWVWRKGRKVRTVTMRGGADVWGDDTGRARSIVPPWLRLYFDDTSEEAIRDGWGST